MQEKSEKADEEAVSKKEISSYLTRRLTISDSGLFYDQHLATSSHNSFLYFTQNFLGEICFFQNIFCPFIQYV